MPEADHSEYPPASEPLERFAWRTEQTIDATMVLDHARREGGEPAYPGAVQTRNLKGQFTSIRPAPTDRVWGRWGVEDRPRIKDPGEEEDEEDGLPGLEEASTVDVAMFLEFGTIKMDKRPFLYPAWDENKHLLPGLIASALRAMPNA